MFTYEIRNFYSFFLSEINTVGYDVFVEIFQKILNPKSQFKITVTKIPFLTIPQRISSYLNAFNCICI